MFVLSFKMTKTKLTMVIFSCVALIAFATTFIDNGAGYQTVVQTGVKASSNEDRLSFLNSFGWQIDNEPSEIIEVIIPNEFDSVYDKYNSIQKGQGYDLSKYKGKRIKRYTYVVKNYPTQQESTVNANILICDNKIIGGDICSVALGGFIHGFKLA